MNGLGSNTCIQDAFNLAWKISYVVEGKASKSILKSYNAERQPVGQIIVTRANNALHDHIAVWTSLGILNPTLEARTASLAEISAPTEAGQSTDDEILNYTPNTSPGSRLPHVWLLPSPSPSARVSNLASTIDIAGHGIFTLFTAPLGRKKWDAAASAAAKLLDVEIKTVCIGFRQDFEDPYFG